MGVNLVTAAAIVLIIWLCWLFGMWTTVNNHWFERREYFADAARCNHFEWRNSTVTSVGGGRVQICLGAFLLWASPLMLFGICLFLGLFLILLSRCRPPPAAARHHCHRLSLPSTASPPLKK